MDFIKGSLMNISQNLKLLKDPILIFSLFAIVIMLIALDIYFLLFGLLYYLTILIAINVASKFVVTPLLKFAISESASKSKSKYLLVAIPKKFQKHFEKGEGLLFLNRIILQFNFLALLLIVRYFGLVFEANFGIISGFIVAMILSSIASLIVSPLAMVIFVLEGSIYREFNPDRITLDFPAGLFRRILKSAFGYGNLVALVWLILDLMQQTSDIVYALVLFVLIVLMAVASISFGSLLALITDKRLKPEAITSHIERFDEELKPYSTNYEDWLENLKTLFEISSGTAFEEEREEERDIEKEVEGGEMSEKKEETS